MAGCVHMDQAAELLGWQQKAEVFQHEQEQCLLHITHYGGVVPVHHHIRGGVAIIGVGIMAMRVNECLNGLPERGMPL